MSSKFRLDDSEDAEDAELFYKENDITADEISSKVSQNRSGGIGSTSAEQGLGSDGIETTNVERFDVEDPNSGYGLRGWMKMGGYSRWFDVNVWDVLRRIGRVMTPWRGELLLGRKGIGDGTDDVGVEGEKVDLYGPFWLTTTLILCIAVGANVYELLRGVATKTEVKPMSVGRGLGRYTAVDFENLAQAAAVFYGYVGMASLFVWSGKRYFRLGGGLVYALCIYGYSMAPLIPAVLLCAVSNEILSWIALISAFGLSTWFVFRNIWSEPLAGDELYPGGSGIVAAVSGQPRSGAWYLRFASGFVHCLLGIVVKFRFF